MKMYHGTYMLIGKIDLEKSRKRVDFGKGFYLTDKFGTARDWAIRKVELEGGGIPTVLYYEINENLFTLSGLRFPKKPDAEWLEFICKNRNAKSSDGSKTEPRHNHTWVTGPIADDKVVDVVAEYMREETDAGEAIKRLRAFPQTYQLSLHTSSALAYVNEDDVYYKQLKAGRWTRNWITRQI